MRLNADFSQRAAVPAHQQQWVASPQGGVERVMLDRVGAEKARATSLVRYLPGATFPEHQHPGGEEILVLSGTFADEHARYPQGWYLRNPPGSAHSPASPEGALIFVKLWQMPPTEREAVRVDTHHPAHWQQQADRAVCPLFTSEAEQVSLQRLAPGAVLRPDATGGAELLVLAGELLGAEGVPPLAPHGWCRLPPGDALAWVAGPQGATVYLKTGHLAQVLGLGPEQGPA